MGTFAQYKDSKSKAAYAKPADASQISQPQLAGMAPKPDPKNLSTYFAGTGTQMKKDSNMSHK